MNAVCHWRSTQSYPRTGGALQHQLLILVENGRSQTDGNTSAGLVTRSSPGVDGLPRVDCSLMADTTTVKVQTSTRDLLLQVGASRRQSADQVILAALAAMQRDERRQVAAADARAIKEDPADLAEIRRIQQDMAALHEG